MGAAVVGAGVVGAGLAVVGAVVVLLDDDDLVLDPQPAVSQTTAKAAPT